MIAEFELVDVCLHRSLRPLSEYFFLTDKTELKMEKGNLIFLLADSNVKSPLCIGR